MQFTQLIVLGFALMIGTIDSASAQAPSTPENFSISATGPGCNRYNVMPKSPGFSIKSTDFKEGEIFKTAQRSGVFGAGGTDTSPQLSWSGFPAATKSFVITMYDPDLLITGSGFWHWVVMNIPANVTSLPANAGSVDGKLLPTTAVKMMNDASMARYIGAAPPKDGIKHRYVIAIYAVDVPSLLAEVPPNATPAYLHFVLASHTLARAAITAYSQTL